MTAKLKEKDMPQKTAEKVRGPFYISSPPVGPISPWMQDGYDAVQRATFVEKSSELPNPLQLISPLAMDAFWEISSQVRRRQSILLR
jgi:hypothetical protein